MKITIVKINNDSVQIIKKNNNWKIDQPDPIYQPDLLEPYTRNKPTRQTRHKPTSYDNNFKSQNPFNTRSYQPTQMQNEIPLPYYS